MGVFLASLSITYNRFFYQEVKKKTSYLDLHCLVCDGPKFKMQFSWGDIKHPFLSRL